MNKKITVFWFRRDLRLHDNVGFYNALKSKNPVLPIFIFDKDILDKLKKDDSRVSYIHQELQNIKAELLKIKRGISIFYGKPIDIYKQLSEIYEIDAVNTNHDYEPYANQRDAEIKAFLTSKNINFNTFKDQVIFEKNEIVKKDGNPYKVYTPYSRKWLEAFQVKGIQFYPSEKYLENCICIEKHPFLTLSDIGFTKSNITSEPYNVSTRLINEYEETRNFPAQNATSKLGAHLRFGAVSVRQMVDKASKSSNITFLKELIWREFFMQILWHFPHTQKKAFKPKYDRILWRNDEADFKAWCNGQTGYPLVDAGMRELNKTGFMHNRVRMLVGSFLCKHLLIDWRWGEAYFAEKLLDYEMSSNVGNWQWVAGSGVDASPYFRIFNPTTQIKKFDKDLEYIKKWVPEFQELTYSKEIIEHKFARERCLKVYKEAVS
ncbi:MAG: deoxyribodipyrimidine photo-lyase [Polaribacter sp.]|nr:deoxyribodipyrimidine photo-lyase [Polaribacter sp.]